ncbi:MAG: serine/threonine protein kinase, partial [Planctomycetaceae bacterium]
MPLPPGSTGPAPQDSTAPSVGGNAKTDAAPQRVGRYEIRKKLGAGGMGTVYLALDTTLKRNVALKLLARDKAENTTLVRRFKAEAQAAAHLKHDNIVAIYDAGEADGYLYIALEYIEGTDAANLVAKRGVLPVKRSIELMRQVASALQHASEHKIVHRDIKPGNLMIRRDGVVKLADLGLARIVDETADTSITRTGTTVGTVDYMSPEQARNSKSADVRSDIYSLGCTWYYLLTGSPPFPDGSVTNKLKAHFDSPFPNPHDKNPQVPEAVTAVMRRMAEKDPSKRYQTPKELLADLEVVLLGGSRVSDAILSDMDEYSASDVAPENASGSRRQRRRAQPEDAGEAAAGSGGGRRTVRKKVTELPTGSGKKPTTERPEAGSDLGRAVGFYGLVGIGVVALIAACIWLAQQMNQAVDSGEGDLAKHLSETEKKRAGGDKTSKQVVGSGQPGAESGKAAGTDSGNRRISGEPTPDPTGTGTGKSIETSQPVIRLGGGAEGEAGTAAGGRGDRKITAREREESGHVPGWVTETAELKPPKKTLIVDPRGLAAKSLDNLNQALREVGDEGAQILLAGTGPFPLRA